MARQSRVYRFVSDKDVVQDQLCNIAKKWGTSLKSISAYISAYHHYKQYKDVYRREIKYQIYGLSVTGEEYLLDEAFSYLEISTALEVSPFYISKHFKEYENGKGMLRIKKVYYWVKL